MGRGAVVDTPYSGASSGYVANVTVEVDDGIIDMEPFFHIVGCHAGRIQNIHTDGIVAGGGIDFLESVTGLVVGPFAFAVLEYPDRHIAGFVQAEGHLVCLLVDADGRSEGRRGLGRIRLLRMVDSLGSAGEEQSRSRKDICYSFHNLVH